MKYIWSVYKSQAKVKYLTIMLTRDENLNRKLAINLRNAKLIELD